MSGQIRYSDEFNIDAVTQLTERGYSVKEEAERLGISTKSLYAWMANFRSRNAWLYHWRAVAPAARSCAPWGS